MDRLLLKSVFLDLLYRLDMYFDNELMKDSRVIHNLEIHKDELMQQLAEEVYTNCEKEVYRNYPPETFIWLKAKKIWIDFTRKVKREAARRTKINIEEIAEDCRTENFLQRFEVQNTLAAIGRLLKPDEARLLKLKSEGYNYKQIMEMEGYPSADAAKAKFSRIKNKLQKLFSLS